MLASRCRKIRSPAGRVNATSVAPDPGRYYWQDMQAKHTQAPNKFVEKPGSGVSSGADNYLIALKDASAVRGRGMRMGLYYCGGFDWIFNTRPITTGLDMATSVPQSQDYTFSPNVQYEWLAAATGPV